METQNFSSSEKHVVPWLPLLFLIAALAVYWLSSGPEDMRRLDFRHMLAIPSTRINSAITPSMPPRGIPEGDIAPMAPSAMMQSESAMMDSGVMSEGRAVVGKIMMAPDSYPYPKQNVSINDTREFLKQSYGATMRTRDVQGLTKRAETTVRGFDGRVDSISSSQESGYVQFVVPASKFQAFRDEIEKFVSPRFLSVNISSYNMLPQKQQIEETQGQAETSLADLTTNRANTVAAHKKTVATLQTQINDAQDELVALRALPATTDYAEYTRRTSREAELATLLSTLDGRLSRENSNYNQSIASLDAQIKYANQNLEGVKKQDKNLLDDVATVNGTISLQWISIWDIVQLYVPGNIIAGILLLLAALSYIWQHHRVKLGL